MTVFAYVNSVGKHIPNGVIPQGLAVGTGNFTLGHYIEYLFYRLSVVAHFEYFGNDRSGFRIYIELAFRIDHIPERSISAVPKTF